MSSLRSNARTPATPLSAKTTLRPCASSMLLSAKTLRRSSSTIKIFSPWKRGAESPAGGAVGLLERFEDHRQLVGRDPDAGVLHLERHPGRRGAQRLTFHLVGSGRPDPQRHAALVGELHRVGREVAQHLLQALLIG